MNKNTILLLVLSLIAACGLSYQSGPLIADQPPQTNPSNTIPQNVVEAPVYLPSDQPVQIQTNDIVQEVPASYDADFVRYKQNIILKQHDQNFVSYEYKNVRVDEVASAAIKYCQDLKGQNAKLLEVVMRPNHSRLATFECIDL